METQRKGKLADLQVLAKGMPPYRGLGGALLEGETTQLRKVQADCLFILILGHDVMIGQSGRFTGSDARRETGAAKVVPRPIELVLIEGNLSD